MQTVDEVQKACDRQEEKSIALKVPRMASISCDVRYVYTSANGCGSGTDRMFMHQVAGWMAHQRDKGYSVLIHEIYVL